MAKFQSQPFHSLCTILLLLCAWISPETPRGQTANTETVCSARVPPAGEIHGKTLKNNKITQINTFQELGLYSLKLATLGNNNGKHKVWTNFSVNPSIHCALSSSCCVPGSPRRPLEDRRQTLRLCALPECLQLGKYTGK